MDWPDIGICITPFYKGQEKYLQFINMTTTDGFSSKEEFNSMVNDVYYHNQSDFIVGAIFGSKYNPENMTSLEIVEPLVQMVQMDFTRYLKHFIILQIRCLYGWFI